MLTTRFGMFVLCWACVNSIMAEGSTTHPPAIAEKPDACSQLATLPPRVFTKGSFTVWTEPQDPKPGKQYTIFVEIQVPKSVKKYPRCDLSGVIVGTDGYKDRFGGPADKGIVEVKHEKIRLEACRVPGAAQLVKDVIKIESKLLKEKQEIEIKF